MDYGIHALRVMCCLICALVPFTVLNLRLYLMTVAPFEILSFVVMALAWALQVSVVRPKAHRAPEGRQNV